MFGFSSNILKDLLTKYGPVKDLTSKNNDFKDILIDFVAKNNIFKQVFIDKNRGILKKICLGAS